MKSFIQYLRETKDGDYEGIPPEAPITDEQLDAYYKDYIKNKEKNASSKSGNDQSKRNTISSTGDQSY